MSYPNTTYVYALVRPDEEAIFYIGVGCKGRAWDHQRMRTRGRSLKDNIICKMIDDLGYDEIPVMIIKEGISKEEAFKLERHFIKLIGRHPSGPLANIHPGGQGWIELKKESKLAIGRANSLLRKDGRWFTDGKLSKFIFSNQTPPNGWFPGRSLVWSEESIEKAKASQANRVWITDGTSHKRYPIDEPIPAGWHTGRGKFSEEHKQALSVAHSGKILSEEHKSNIGNSHKGMKRSSFDSSWWNTPEGKAHAHKVWITNGIEETKVQATAVIPEGWQRGRVKGRQAPNKGVRMSEEQKERLRQVNRGKSLSEETRAKIGASLLGRKRGKYNMSKKVA